MAFLQLSQVASLFTIGIIIIRGGLASSLFARAVGVADTPLSLHLYDPIIVDASVVVVKNRPVSLVCPVRSLHPYQVTWFREGVEIARTSTTLHDEGTNAQRTSTSDADDGRNDTNGRNDTVVRDDGALYIPRVAVADRGQYQCLARNRMGALLSNPVTIRLASMDRDFSQESTGHVSVHERHPVVLNCSINSLPRAKIVWERDNTALPQNIRYVPLPNGALFITETHSSDAGSFRCKATNSLLKKTRTSKSGLLTIVTNEQQQQPKAPTFLPQLSPTNVTVDIGSDVTLYCAAIGWSLPSVRWIKNNTIVGNSSILHVVNVTMPTGGNHNGYRCQATNHMGTTHQDYWIKVQQKPYFNITPTSKTYLSGVTVRLECQAVGVPTPRLHWLKDGHEMALGARVKMHANKLIFSHTFSYDEGIYQCVAENSAGRLWSAAQLQLAGNGTLTTPRPPENVKCRPYDHRSVCLQWQPPNNVSVQAYTIYSFYKVMDVAKLGPDYVTNMTHHLAIGLDSGTNYTFYVRLFSNVASDQSENVTCMTGMQGNRDLRVMPLNATAVQLSWSQVSTDLPCDSITKALYEVQWRVRDRAVNKVDYTQKTKHVISGMSSATSYEFRVISTAHKASNQGWLLFDRAIGGAVIASDDREDTNVRPPQEVHVEVMSPTEVGVAWSANVTEGGDVRDYQVCYGRVTGEEGDEEEEEDGGEGGGCQMSVRSSTNRVEIYGLLPDTMYSFKVSARYKNGYRSTYSNPVEVRTRKNVVTPVTNLTYRLLNVTAACLTWNALETPLQNKEAAVTEYIVTYSPDPNRPLETWLSKSVPPVGKVTDCSTHTNGTVIATVLTDLSPDKEYMVYVRAVSAAGPGNPTKPIIIKTMTSSMVNDSTKQEEHNRENGSDNSTKLGTLIGLTVAVLGIILCLLCIVARRRCIKRRTPAPVAVAATAAHYVTDTGHVRVDYARSRASAAASGTVVLDRHEVERLVGHDTATENDVASVTQADRMTGRPDAKGIRDHPHPQFVPNGHVNGFAINSHANGGGGLIMTDHHDDDDDGHVLHITENPRYVKYEKKNGRRKPTRHRRTYEEDTNSNLTAMTDHSYDSDRLNVTELTCLEVSAD